MDHVSSDHARAKRLSSLASAAEFLAKAAVTLSEAARAAAEAFSEEISVSSPQFKGSSGLPSGVYPIVSYESDPELSPSVERPRDSHEATNGTGQTIIEGEFEDEECTNPEDSDYYISDDDDNANFQPTEQTERDARGDGVLSSCSAGPISLEQLRFDPNRPPPSVLVEPEIAIKPHQAYRLLIDNEPDVLLFVCALIRKRRKVVCYMNCSIPAFDLYKRLINAVTGMSVHTITKITSAELNQVGQSFLEDTNSILLLPETVSPSIEIDETDSWVVHIGWPSDEQQYEEQRTAHQATNNVLVAYSENENLYPAGAAIMWQSNPWPGDVDSFRVSVAVLRPVFDQKLAEIPAEMKEKVYPDWISCHGPRGHRYVKAWTPSALVYRANLYLLDVLRYKGRETEDSASTLQVPLPEVSAGFMAHNGLEAAVQEGVLRIKITGSGLNHISSLPKDDFVPPGTVSLNEGETGRTSNDPPSNKPPQLDTPKRQDQERIAASPAMSVPASFPGVLPKAKDEDEPPEPAPLPPKPAPPPPMPALPPPNPALPPPKPALPPPSTSTKPTGQDRPPQAAPPPRPSPIRNYLIIEAEFDVIPSICYLSDNTTVKNAICFVKSLSAMEPLTEMMKQVIAKPIFIAKSWIALSQAAKNALRSATGCIIFCDAFYDLPAELKTASIDAMVHVGWSDSAATYKTQTELSSLKSATVVLTRREVQDPTGAQLIASLGQAGISAIDVTIKRLYNRQTDAAIIAPHRKLWRAALSAGTAILHVRTWYMAWITHHYTGRCRQPNWTAVDVVAHANRYMKEALLHGYGRAGEVVRGRPPVTAGFVRHLRLEEAVFAGIITVIG